MAYIQYVLIFIVVFAYAHAASLGTSPKTLKQDAKPIEDAQHWQNVAYKQLNKILKIHSEDKDNNYQKKAKNIIIFVGDGMGVSTVTAGRIFKGQYVNKKTGEEGMLVFDKFPYTGISKTYCVDKQVPDSAATATAIFCGSKTDYNTVGLDSRRSTTDAKQGRLHSIMDWGQAVGKRTGVVTTTRITHATPAATYAHVYHRSWECDTKVLNESIGIHADIARQLIENAPGNKFNVIMGGGLSALGAFDANEKQTVKFSGISEDLCKRGDGRNLIEEWLKKSQGKEKRTFVQKRADLLKVDTAKTDRLMGIFRNSHITFTVSKEEDEPTLAEMTKVALGVLERGNDSPGYVLAVEAGHIDIAHHQNYARAAMHEVLNLDKAVETALKMTNDEETLIIVTADHSHALTLTGYPQRGNDILSFANRPDTKPVYETLSYANGPAYWEHLANKTGSFWIPLETFTNTQHESPTYRHMATLPIRTAAHGGEDVIVFANGPGSSLVRGVFEQNYIAYIMSYAGCMGPARTFDETCSASSIESLSVFTVLSILHFSRFLVKF